LSHKKIPAEYKAFSAVDDDGEINSNNLEMNQWWSIDLVKFI